MLSGRPFLRLWYHDREEFRLEHQFSQDPHVPFVTRLLAKCVVEDETDCLPNANDLLDEIDKMLLIIRMGCE